MRRPLLWPALAFALGVVASDACGPGVVGIWAAAIAAWAVAPFVGRFAASAITAGFGLAGAAAMATGVAPLSSIDLRVLAPAPPVIGAVRGVIAETPTFRLPEPRGSRAGRTLARVKVEAWRTAEGVWVAARGWAVASVPGELGVGFFRGQRIEITGALDFPPGPAASGLFDYRGFLGRQGIWYMLRTESLADWKALPEGPAPPWAARFLPWARVTLMRGLPDDEAARLLPAMALGWRTPLTGAVAAPFMNASAMHLFAISGLHIALLAWLVGMALRLARVGIEVAGLAALPVAWLYISATGGQAAAVRAGVMSAAVAVAFAVRRPGDLLNSLSAAALAVLVWEPGQIFLAGFQLSFAAMAGLAVLGRPIRDFARRLFAPSHARFLPREWSRRPAWVEAAIEAVATSLAFGVSVTVATLPITIHWFHVASPVGLISNLAAGPIASAVLTACAGSLVVSPAWGWLGEVFNAAGWALMHALMAVCATAQRLPGGHWHVAAPPVGWWIPYYAGLIAAGSGWLSTVRRRQAAVAAVVVYGASALGAWLHWHAADRLIALGDGSAALVRSGWRTALLDAGDAASAERTVLPWLEALGLDHLDQLVATRLDMRHIGGIGAVLEAFHPSVVISSRAGRRWPGARALANALSERPAAWTNVAVGASLPPWKVLFPGPSPGATADESSLALARNFGGVRVVWLANLGRAAQRRLVEFSPPPADLVFTAPVGEGDPWGEALWEALKPALVVVLPDRRNGPRPGPAARARWSGHGAAVVFTAEHGTVTLECRGGDWRLYGLDGALWKGRAASTSR